MFPSLGFASHSICLPTSFSWSHCQWSGVEVSVDVTWVGDGVGLPGVPVVGGVDAGVDGALVEVEADVGPGVGSPASESRPPWAAPASAAG